MLLAFIEGLLHDRSVPKRGLMIQATRPCVVFRSSHGRWRLNWVRRERRHRLGVSLSRQLRIKH